MTKQEWLEENGNDPNAAKLLRDVPEEAFSEIALKVAELHARDGSVTKLTLMRSALSGFNGPKSVRKSFVFTPRAAEMLADVREQFGFASDAAALHHCIVESHRKAFPTYAAPPRRADARTPDERRRDARRAEADRASDDALAECRRVAAALKGVTYVDGGVEYVRWNTYSFGDSYENAMPLDQMTPALIEQQYQPDRETCERMSRK